MQVYALQNISSYNSIQMMPMRHREVVRKQLFENSNADCFVGKNNSYAKSPSFTGSLFDAWMTKFLKSRSTSYSIRASKFFQLPKSKDLENIVKDVRIDVGNGENIVAWDINPANAKKYIIFLHGFSQNVTSNQPLYKSVSETGYGVLAIDYRGYGKSSASRNTSDSALVQDVQAAYKYLKAKGVEDVGLVGHSFGGYVAAKSSKANDFNFQILVSPMLSLEFWLKNVIRHPRLYPNEYKMIKYFPKYKDQYKKVYNIESQLVDNHTSTYIIQSQKDNYVRTSALNKVVAKIPNLKGYSKLKLGTHKMDEPKIKEIVAIIEGMEKS